MTGKTTLHQLYTDNTFTYDVEILDYTDKRRNQLLACMSWIISRRTKKVPQKNKRQKWPTIYIDKRIFKDANMKQKNVTMAWID